VASGHRIPSALIVKAGQFPGGFNAVRGDLDRCELAGEQQPSEQFCVFDVGLHPVRGRPRSFARCDDFHCDSGGGAECPEGV
jgi:hypothetical protein